jgi:hypothetical protein
LDRLNEAIVDDQPGKQKFPQQQCLSADQIPTIRADLEELGVLSIQ